MFYYCKSLTIVYFNLVFLVEGRTRNPFEYGHDKQNRIIVEINQEQLHYKNQ